MLLQRGGFQRTASIGDHNAETAYRYDNLVAAKLVFSIIRVVNLDFWGFEVVIKALQAFTEFLGLRKFLRHNHQGV